MAERATHETLEAALRAHPDVVCVEGLLFEHLELRASGEQIEVGYRCFACDDASLLEAFHLADPAALAALPPALDDDGRPIPSRVRLDLAFAPAGTIAGAQPVRYEGYKPVPAAAPRVICGEAARAWADALAALDHQPRD